jgi:proton-translocating NADH-quinone oxidoreductase chain N
MINLFYLLPALPILILLIGAFVTYACGRLLYRFKLPNLTGLVALFFLLLSAMVVLSFYVHNLTGLKWYLFGNEQLYLKIDGIAIFLGIVPITLGGLVAIYSIRYMDRETGLEKYYTLLILMIAGMVGIGFAGDLFNMFIFFEIMAITSYILVAFQKEKWEPIEAGMKYVIMSVTGSLVALLGISMIFMYAGTLEFAALPAKLANIDLTILMLAITLCIIGFGLKAAIVPLHTWLPDAHSAAPSGISAMLSGIVIQAGLVALIKTVYVFPQAQLHFGLLLAIFAVITMTVGNVIALLQRDLKRLLAYSSIAQMGYILLGIGLGFEYSVRAGYTGGFFHILNHAFMKGGAFLCAGAILYAINTRNLSDMRGIGRKMPVVGICFTIFALGLAGTPPFAGFISELFVVKAGVDAGGWAIFFAVATVVNVIISLGYYLPAIKVIMFSKDISRKAENAKPAPIAISFPIVIMALITVVLGILPQIGLTLVNPAVNFLLGS